MMAVGKKHDGMGGAALEGKMLRSGVHEHLFFFTGQSTRHPVSAFSCYAAEPVTCLLPSIYCARRPRRLGGGLLSQDGAMQ
jgi:hypothetical protein